MALIRPQASTVLYQRRAFFLFQMFYYEREVGVHWLFFFFWCMV